MPLYKDVGIKNSLPMQLLPTRGVTGLSANRLSEYQVQSSQSRGLHMDKFILMCDHYVWFVDCWREVWLDSAVLCLQDYSQAQQSPDSSAPPSFFAQYTEPSSSNFVAKGFKLLLIDLTTNLPVQVILGFINGPS